MNHEGDCRTAPATPGMRALWGECVNEGGDLMSLTSLSVISFWKALNPSYRFVVNLGKLGQTGLNLAKLG